MTKAESGGTDDYLDSLKAEHTTVFDEAIREKVLLSYEIMIGDAANPDDGNILIEKEVPNWAALDTIEAKMDAIADTVYGSQAGADESDKQAMRAHAAIRKIRGDKALQEIYLTK